MLHRWRVLREYDTLQVECLTWTPKPASPPTMPNTANRTLQATGVTAANLLKHYHDAARWAGAELVAGRNEELQSNKEYQISAIVELLRRLDEEQVDEEGLERHLKKWTFLNSYVKKRFTLGRGMQWITDTSKLETKLEELQRELFQDEVLELQESRNDITPEEYQQRLRSLEHRLARRRLFQQVEGVIFKDPISGGLMSTDKDVVRFLKERWAHRWRPKNSDGDIIREAVAHPKFTRSGVAASQVGASWERATTEEAEKMIAKMHCNGKGPDRRGARVYKKSPKQTAQLLIRLLGEVGTSGWDKAIKDAADSSLDRLAFLSFLLKNPSGVGDDGEMLYTENDVRPITVATHLLRMLQRLLNVPLLRCLAPHLPACFHGWIPGGQLDTPIVNCEPVAGDHQSHGGHGLELLWRSGERLSLLLAEGSTEHAGGDGFPGRGD